MPCIVCLATLAAIGFGVGMAVDEVLTKPLERVAQNGRLVRETDSVATWRGEFRVVLDDGTTKLVAATIHLFKDSNRVKIHIEDHSLSTEEAERLEDDIVDALDGTVVERRYPPSDPESEAHSHEEEGLEDIPQEETPAAPVENQRHSPRR